MRNWCVPLGCVHAMGMKRVYTWDEIVQNGRLVVNEILARGR